MLRSTAKVRLPRPLPFAVVLLGVLAAAAVKTTPAAAQYGARAEFVPTFSTSTRLKQQVQRLGRLAEQKLWKEWLAGYQQLVDDPRDSVIARDEEFLVGIRYHLHGQLAALPAGVRQLYRQLYDADARKVFDKAQQTADAAGMRDVYSRYRFSTSAGKALLWLGNQALDEGRPEMARVAYARLAREPGAGAGLLLRYALAADAARRPAEARAALERIRKDFGAEPVQLGGQSITGAEAAVRLVQVFRKDPPPPTRRWTAFQGETGDRRMPVPFSGGLKRLWTYNQPTALDTSRPTASPSFGFKGKSFTFLSFPAVQGDRLWVQGPRNLAGLELASGKALWDDQKGWRSNPEEGMPAAAEGRNGRGYSSQSSLRPLQAAPCVDGNLLVSRIPLIHPDGVTWPYDFAIAAYDSRSGRPLWRRVAGGESRSYYWNIPAVQNGVVFSGINSVRGGISEYSAVALDASTGETLWTTYLGGGSDHFLRTDGSPGVVRDGVVWLETTLYTLSAVDLMTGEVRVIYRYTPERRPYAGRGWDSGPSIPNEPISLIASAPGPIVFAPRWGTEVAALDPVSGKLLWSSPKSPSPNAPGVLFGADQKHVYIWGDYIQAINIADGAPGWTWELNGTGGFAALCGDHIYAPIEGKIHVHAAADNRPVAVLEPSQGKDDLANLQIRGLVAADGLLLLLADDRVIAFGPDGK